LTLLSFIGKIADFPDEISSGKSAIIGRSHFTSAIVADDLILNVFVGRRKSATSGKSKKSAFLKALHDGG
jgi:hypothetical protein